MHCTLPLIEIIW